uniref:Uncharacterized protein n=1 Tax=Vitis vinifera TaxID=29760 RepID=F6GYS6_VITVI
MCGYGERKGAKEHDRHIGALRKIGCSTQLPRKWLAKMLEDVATINLNSEVVILAKMMIQMVENVGHTVF